MEKIKEIVKTQYKILLQIAGYIAIACLIYGVWFQSLWHLWYVTLLTIIAVIAAGCVFGYFYLKSEIKKNDTTVEGVKNESN